MQRKIGYIHTVEKYLVKLLWETATFYVGTLKTLVKYDKNAKYSEYCCPNIPDSLGTEVVGW